MSERKIGEGAILAVLTGGDVSVDAGLQALKTVQNQGWPVTAVLSQAAERIVGIERVKAVLGAGSVVTGADAGAAMQAVSRAALIVVPVLSLATAAKVALLAPDTPASNLLVHALMTGRKVILARDSVICGCTPRETVPFAIKRKIEEYINTLRSYGAAVTDAEHLGREMAKALEGKKPVPAGGTMTASAAIQVASQAVSTKALVAAASATAQATVVAARPAGNPVSGGSPGTQCAGHSGECEACGHCASKNSGNLKKVVEQGADRVSQSLGVSGFDTTIASMIDHTLLKPEATAEQVDKLCQEALKCTFASVCVNPSNVAQCHKLLKGSPVKVCTVIGFPLGATTPTTKAMETRDAIANGAQEVDMVINVGALKSGDYDLVSRDIKAVVDAAQGKAIVKVILETALLTDEEKVKGCLLAKYAGADFVKTSTGFGPGGATVKDIALMRATVGPDMGVKASGGIRDYETAQTMVQAGANRIGASASVAIAKGPGQGEKGKGY